MARASGDSLSAILYGLEDEIARELASALAACGHQVDRVAWNRPSGRVLDGADVIFCPADVHQVRELKENYPDAPVVVASRLPEVSDWLDALEAGAADYCAAPFEPAQLRWVLQPHISPTA